ncbi:MAG: hypothetical protein QXT06_08185 [Candidatus Bathyarchaeia archaeon]
MSGETANWYIEFGRDFVYFGFGKKYFILRDIGQGKYQFMLPESAEEVKANEIFNKLKQYLEMLREAKDTSS